MQFLLKAEVATHILSLFEGRTKLAHPSIKGTGLKSYVEISDEEAQDEGVKLFLSRGWISLTPKEEPSPQLEKLETAITDAVVASQAAVEPSVQLPEAQLPVVEVSATPANPPASKSRRKSKLSEQ